MVIGVDLGPAYAKAVAFDTGGRRLAGASAGYPLAEPHPGWAERDPGADPRRGAGPVCAVVPEVDGRVAALSFSSAMHTLIGLDAAGAPLTPSLTWATRGPRRKQSGCGPPGGLALHRRTGTPLHPMAPLPKLAWFHEERAGECSSGVGYWVGIKDYVLSGAPRRTRHRPFDRLGHRAAGYQRWPGIPRRSTWPASRRPAARAGPDARRYCPACPPRPPTRAAARHARRRRRGRRPAGQPGRRSGQARRGRLLDRHQRGAAGHSRASRRSTRADGLSVTP